MACPCGLNKSEIVKSGLHFGNRSHLLVCNNIGILRKKIIMFIPKGQNGDLNNFCLLGLSSLSEGGGGGSEMAAAKSGLLFDNRSHVLVCNNLGILRKKIIRFIPEGQNGDQNNFCLLGLRSLYESGGGDGKMATAKSGLHFGRGRQTIESKVI